MQKDNHFDARTIFASKSPDNKSVVWFGYNLWCNISQIHQSDWPFYELQLLTSHQVHSNKQEQNYVTNSFPAIHLDVHMLRKRRSQWPRQQLLVSRQILLVSQEITSKGRPNSCNVTWIHRNDWRFKLLHNRQVHVCKTSVHLLSNRQR